MIFDFSTAQEQLDNESKETLGGKAYGLCQLHSLGLNVPRWMSLGCALSLNPPDLDSSETMIYFASRFRKVFGDDDIISVRSGAPISMPGMMDTLLNIGVCDDNFENVIRKYGEDAAYDIYARLTRQYSVFEGMKDDKFAEIEKSVNVFYKHVGMEGASKKLYESYRDVRGKPMPPRMDQVKQAIKWVWESYNSDRAIAYRDMNEIPHDIGTGVVLQKMVFGNLNEKCGTGVAFSHDPNTGEKGLMGDFLANGQGEEVVSGLCDTTSIVSIAKDPEWYKPIKTLRKAVIKILNNMDFKMLDIEFTIEDGILYFLQVREAKCSNKAKVRLLVDNASAGTLSADNVVDELMSMLPKFAEKMNTSVPSELTPGELVAGEALGAVDGRVVGRIATTHDQANKFHQEGTPFIFVAELTSPDDLIPMSQSVGIMTRTGGMLSHAAIIAREWGKVAVVAFSDMAIESPTTISINGESHSVVTLDVSNQKGRVLV